MAILPDVVFCGGEKKTVMIPRPTLFNVPAAEESALGNSPDFEDDNDLTYISINDRTATQSDGKEGSS